MKKAFVPASRFTLFSAVIAICLSACTDPGPDASQQQLIASLTEPERKLFEHGQLKAYSCAACHGRNGISSHPNYPSLAGRSANELSAALTAYRGGERKHALMTPQARGLNDADINALAYYFSLQLPAASAATQAD
ncbi:c-type cytochrome [Arsukibacterium indicum]|uniref:Cytochrome c n=1 Tax=Arsukibacterium indicum TaxID=2848612 RepID=A0ABS6MKN0_9GAMM|nr:cytochrome c [Arsukibacterium indicum]MBV2129280.1 cytochrome c [Arsukibacterium indicum]